RNAPSRYAFAAVRAVAGGEWSRYRPSTRRSLLHNATWRFVCRLAVIAGLPCERPPATDAGTTDAVLVGGATRVASHAATSSATSGMGSRRRGRACAERCRRRLNAHQHVGPESAPAQNPATNIPGATPVERLRPSPPLQVWRRASARGTWPRL